MTEPHPDRPRFFGGQLLTERDLDDLVSWTRSCVRRLGRAHGAQVLEGLAVSALDGEQLSLRIAAGSALDGTGQLVVQSEERDLTIPEQALDRAREAGPLRRAESFCRLGDHKQVRFPLLLTLRHREKPTEPRSRLGHHAGSADGIENSRVRELAEFRFATEGDGAPTADDPGAWGQAFAETTGLVTRFLETFIADGASADGLDGEAVRGWFRAELAEQDMHAFAFLPDLVERLATDELRAGATVARLLLLAVLDRRLALLHDPGSPATDDPAGSATSGAAAGELVLARLWIGEGEEPGSDRRLLAVDQVPSSPQLGSDLPAPEGRLNLADVLWASPGEGEALVSRRGLRFSSEDPLDWSRDLTSLDALVRCLEVDPFVAPWDEIVLRTLDLGDMGRRVVGFEALGEGRPLHVRVEALAHPRHVVPGQEVSLVVRLHNTGPVPLRGRLELLGQPLGEPGLLLPPRVDVEQALRWRVPQGRDPGARSLEGRLLVQARGVEDEVESTWTLELEVLDPVASQFTHEVEVTPHALAGRLDCQAAVTNTGSTDLTLALTWSLGTLSREPVALEVPVGETVRPPAPARARLGRRVPLTLEINGRGADGRRVGVTTRQALPSGLGVAPWLLVLVFCALSWSGGLLSGADEPSPLTWGVALAGVVYLAWRFWPNRTRWLP